MLQMTISSIFKTVKADRYLREGLTGVLIAFVCGAGFYALSVPWFGTADEIHHLDYSWRVYNAELPVFEDGVTMPVERSAPSFQSSSQHPPLYYAVLAPFVGPFIDSGNWQIATALGRFITILIGVANIAVLAWAGWFFGGKRRRLYAIALPGIMTSLAPFVLFAGAIYNDMLIVFATTSVLIVCAYIIKKGLNPVGAVSLAALVAIGMMSRASFVSMLAIVVVSVFGAVIFNSKDEIYVKLVKSMLYSLLVVAPGLIASGWFYWRNFQLSGDWSRSAPTTWSRDLLGRDYRPLSEVLGGKNLWLLLPEGLFGRPWRALSGAGRTINTIVSTLVFAFLGVGSSYVAFTKKAWKDLDRKQLLIFCLFVAHMLFILGQQIVHATGYGAFNVRYFLPIWLPLGLIILYGAFSFSRLKAYMAILMIILGWVSSMGATVNLMFGRHGVSWDNITPWLRSEGFLTSEIHAVILVALLFGLCMGVIMQAKAITSIYKANDINLSL